MKPRRRPRGAMMFLVAAGVAAAGFLVIPRSWLPEASPTISTAATYVATRIPEAQVSAAIEKTPALALERPGQSTSASMIALPLPKAAIAPSTAVVKTPIPASQVAADPVTANHKVKAKAAQVDAAADAPAAQEEISNVEVEATETAPATSDAIPMTP